jgi:2-haloacid dehalogenase
MKLKGKPIDGADYTVVTFDCYGTLIDWETGILEALRPVFDALGLEVDDDTALELYGEIEPVVQEGEFKLYADVLRGVMDGIAERLGFVLADGERDALVDSIGDWPAFSDTAESLDALKRRFKLYVLSNIDDELFARTAPNLGVELDGVITAQQVQSYKPAPGHFERLLEQTGVRPHRVLHIAQSLFHDVQTARSMGFGTVWVNRRGDRPGGGATPPSDARPDLEVRDLATLALIIAGD